MNGLIDLLGLGNIFGTLAAIGVAIMFLEEVIDRLWNLDGIFSQARTLVVGIGLGLVGAFFDLGMFADPACCGEVSDLVCGSTIGFAAAVGANVVFLTPLSKALLEILKIRPKSQ